MNRLQISDQFQGGQLQTQARPMAQTEAVAPVREDTRWKALAGAFASGELIMDTQRKQKQADDTSRATQYANSMTVAELGKGIKEGKMFASESPVFAATVQHIWGQNSHDALTRDLTSKITTGELKFNSPTEADEYLTEARNTALAGGSEYARAGFDKGYAQLREKLMGSVAQNNDKENVDQASNAAYDRLSNKLLAVSGADFKGTPKDAADALLSEYHLLRQTQVLPAAAAKGALGEVIARAAAGGKSGVLEALLNSELPDVGSVRGFLGEAKAQTLLAQSGNNFDKSQRQRIDDEVLPFMQASDGGTLNVEKFLAWSQSDANKRYVTASTIHSITRANDSAIAQQQVKLEKEQRQGAVLASEYQAQKQVDAALSAGTLWEVQGTNTPQVMTTSGDSNDFNVKAYAEQALKVKAAGLPFAQQVNAWASNGLENPDWKAQMQAGLLNLSSIGIDAKGKPAGQLNDAGRKAVTLFQEMDAVNPDAAKLTAGDAAYKRFSDIGFLMHLGRDVSDAASIATTSGLGALAGTPADKLEKQVRVEVEKLGDTPWMDWLSNTAHDTGDFLARNNPVTLAAEFAYGVGRAVTGFDEPGPVSDNRPAWLKSARQSSAMHSTTPNTAQVHSWVKRYATLLAHSGQVGDAETALKLAVEYIGNPKVSAKVNGTLYLRSELPTPPKGGTSEVWLGKFIDAVPKARAKELEFAGDQVRLEYDERSRIYRAFVAGLPLEDAEGNLMVFPKTKIQEWYANQNQVEVNAAAARGTAQQPSKNHKAYEARLMGEMGALQKTDRFVMERYGNTTYGASDLSSKITSRAAYDRISKDGNQDKSLSELMKLYPARK